MKAKLVASALVAAALVAGCDRPPATKSEFNNSGASATPAQPAANPGVSASAPASSAAANANSVTVASVDPATVVVDTVTTGKVKAAFAGDAGMKDSDVSVETRGGVVTLSGSVKTQDQVAIATALAQRQEGVQRVESQVTVK